ncbi:MAG: hypothetical protein BWK80_03525 [Desulfobacteraceae bacterium IS3]|nr:MAG: hypothetical protein BWK80_03525 [Desulfobacteraceae bacterium IS3]
MTVVSGFFQNIAELQGKIEKRLKEVNRSMSTYIKDSEISRFNALKSTEEKFYISDDFLQVMVVAKHLYEITNGAWDGTVNPLVNLWGFGSTEKKEDAVPNPAEIQQFLADVGFDQIEISEEKYLRKKNASISLDLASIAKGFGVDQVAEVIEKSGFADFLVEIGGEVYASGFRKDSTSWRVGINTPQKNASLDAVYKVVPLHNKALATSGDYRIFFEADGKRYSHILDPTTGYPVTNRVVSASVIADNCTFADGLATALMVLGHEKAVALAEKLNNVECLMVVQETDGALKDYYSKGFQTVP